MHQAKFLSGGWTTAQQRLGVGELYFDTTLNQLLYWGWHFLGADYWRADAQGYIEKSPATT